MAGKTVVMVLDRDDPKRGEITMLADTHEAARMAEELLESGVETERIRIFDATELAMKVAHKPVVSLGDDADEEQRPLAAQSADEADSVPVLVSETQGEPAEEEPLVRNGVRFSSLFRSDEA